MLYLESPIFNSHLVEIHPPFMIFHSLFFEHRSLGIIYFRVNGCYQ